MVAFGDIISIQQANFSLLRLMKYKILALLLEVKAVSAVNKQALFQTSLQCLLLPSTAAV